MFCYRILKNIHVFTKYLTLFSLKMKFRLFLLRNVITLINYVAKYLDTQKIEIMVDNKCFLQNISKAQYQGRHPCATNGPCAP